MGIIEKIAREYHFSEQWKSVKYAYYEYKIAKYEYKKTKLFAPTKPKQEIK